MKIKRLTALLLVMVMTVLALPSLTVASTDWGKWYEGYVAKAIERKWMTGGTEDYNRTVTRLESAEMLYSVLDRPLVKSVQNPFTDIPTDLGTIYTVTSLYEAGIFLGVGAGLFAPNDVLTREMAFTIMARAFGLQAKNTNAYQRFADSESISNWARPAVSAMVENVYVIGRGDNMCVPRGSLTKAELITLMVRIYDGEKSKYADGPGELDPDAEQQLCKDYWQSLETIYPGNVALDMISVYRYYGTFSGCEAVYMSDQILVYPQAVRPVVIANFIFNFHDGQPLLIHKGSELLAVEYAYKAGWITKEDVKTLWWYYNKSYDESSFF